jgi:hypothetical protein
MTTPLFPNSVASLLLVTLAALIQTPTAGLAAESNPDSRVYELRTYYAAPGKLEALQSRFRDHTSRIFEKHGMQNLGYWVPVDNPENKLIYILSFPSREAATSSWKDFFADPDWQKVQTASEANGRLVTKVESVFMKATDYSPAIKSSKPAEPRLFELRTYTAASGKLDDLNRRFREKTLALFDKHSITSVGYWLPADKDKGADNTLIYIVAHKDKPSAEASWKAFRADPDWVATKAASEVHGSLTVPNGVKSVFMTPADYSPIQ